MRKSLCSFCRDPVINKIESLIFRCLLIGRIKANAQETKHHKINVIEK